MTEGVIVVTGATGNIGSKLVRELLARKKKVRAFARGKEKLDALAHAGAEVVAGALDDAAALERALTGAKSAFFMIPPNYAAENFRAYQNRTAENFEKALIKTGVKELILLSSVGAHLDSGSGAILGLHDAEKRFEATPGLSLLSLRPAYFMENHFWGIPVIKEQGFYGSALTADRPFAMIATRDIAHVAAEIFSSSIVGHHVREILGYKDYTLQESARILGAAIGKPNLSYQQFPYDAVQAFLLSAGFSKSAAALMIEMYHGLNDGKVAACEKRSSENTTHTSLETFAQFFAKAY